MKPTFQVLIGIAGCGKSTWIHNNIDRQNYAIVSPDKIRIELGNISDQSNNVLVWGRTKEKTIKLLSQGKDIILDATNVNTEYRRDFLDGLPECNLIAQVFDIHPVEAYQRIKSAIEQGEIRADVPEHVIYRMYGEFLYTKRVLKEEGYKYIFLIS